MTEEPGKDVVPHGGEAPNLLDFPVKDPLRETYQGQWKQEAASRHTEARCGRRLGLWCVS